MGSSREDPLGKVFWSLNEICLIILGSPQKTIKRFNLCKNTVKELKAFIYLVFYNVFFIAHLFNMIHLAETRGREYSN